MIKLLLHKIITVCLFILLGGWACHAQKTVVKGSELSFSAEENSSFKYHWSVVNAISGLVETILPSNTYDSGIIPFENVGLYYVEVFPINKMSSCRGESLRIPITVIQEQPTAWFENLTNDYVCSSNNGDSANLTYFTVQYKGPKPWSFKVSVDGGAPEQLYGADKIWDDSFTFQKGFYNNSTRQKKFILQLVELSNAQNLDVKVDNQTQSTIIDVLPLPKTKFIDINPVAHPGETLSYSALVEEESTYELFVPENASINNETINDIKHKYLKLLKFDITWGHNAGNKQIKILEKNIYECAGDTIFANINIVDETFISDLGEDIYLCVGDKTNIAPKLNINQNYNFLWSTGETTQSIEVNTSGTYIVEIKDDNNNIVDDEINVIFNSLPIVSLGDDQIIKPGGKLTLESNEECNACTYLWNTDQTTSSITVDRPGKYFLEIVDENTCVNTDTIIVKSGPSFLVDLGPDRVECGEFTLIPELDKSIDPLFYWMPGGKTNTLVVNTTGKYCLNVTDKTTGDMVSDCVFVKIKDMPIVDLGKDRVLVSGQELDAGNASDWKSYKWYFKDTFTNKKIPDLKSLGLEQKQIVEMSGLYIVDVENNQGCISNNEVQVTVSEKALINVPTAFSPNGDGVNDLLIVKGKLPMAAKYNIIIYNRLGHRVFSSNDISLGWDGKVNGELQDLDVYVYFVEIEYSNGEKIHQKGNITLVY